jgi:hypothetical protein
MSDIKCMTSTRDMFGTSRFVFPMHADVCARRDFSFTKVSTTNDTHYTYSRVRRQHDEYRK